jgi:hypothetical protein
LQGKLASDRPVESPKSTKARSTASNEKSALDAASTSSKLVDDATKEVLGSRPKDPEMRKQISDLSRKQGWQDLRLKFDRLKSDLDTVNKEKSALFQKKRLGRSLKVLKKAS